MINLDIVHGLSARAQHMARRTILRRAARHSDAAAYTEAAAPGRWPAGHSVSDGTKLTSYRNTDRAAADTRHYCRLDTDTAGNSRGYAD